jgi:hypothetical protein
MVRLVAPYASNALNKVHDESAQPTAENSAEQSVAPKWTDPGWVILDRATYVRLDQSGGYDATLEFSTKALTESGAKALVEDKHNYDPNRETVTLENFATVKADGSILPVDPIAVLDRTADPTLPEPYLDDKRVKVIVFPDVAPGDVVRGRHVARAAIGVRRTFRKHLRAKRCAADPEPSYRHRCAQDPRRANQSHRRERNG